MYSASETMLIHIAESESNVLDQLSFLMLVESFMRDLKVISLLLYSDLWSRK